MLLKKLSNFWKIFQDTYEKEISKITNKEEISAVYEKDLKEYLRSLDLLDDINNGKINCEFCRKTITFDNLQCIFPKDNEIKICCNNSYCYLQSINKR